jgi:hypothetical protein
MDSYLPKLEKILDVPVKWFLYQAPGADALSPRLGEGGTWYLVEKNSRPVPNTPSPSYFASFMIEQLRGCCGVCVSTGAHVRAEYTRQGIGTMLNEMRLGMAKRLGYGVMLCTTVMDNIGEGKILATNGWREMYTFVNPRTSRKLGVFLRTLHDIPMDGPVFAKGAPAARATKSSLLKAGKL